MFDFNFKISTIYIITALATASPRDTAGISCYQCSTEAVFTDGEILYPESMEAVLLIESCESLEQAFSWSPFVIACGEGEVCTKLSVSGPEEIRTVRGCSHRNDSIGHIHPLGCGTMRSTRFGPSDSEFSMGDQICMCDTDYCNSANDCNQMHILMFILLGMTVSFWK